MAKITIVYFFVCVVHSAIADIYRHFFLIIIEDEHPGGERGKFSDESKKSFSFDTLVNWIRDPRRKTKLIRMFFVRCSFSALGGNKQMYVVDVMTVKEISITNSIKQTNPTLKKEPVIEKKNRE